MIDLLAKPLILDRQLHGSWGITPVGGDTAMSRSTYFVQECPTCGRNLQVRVEYLGKQVVCQHCRARFEACEPGSAAYPPSSSSLSLLERAEQLLQTTGASSVATAPAMMSDVMALPMRPK
jgi:hypothetical protein